MVYGPYIVTKEVAMTTLAERLAYLNELCAREDRSHLKSWKESRKALEDAIAKIEARLPKEQPVAKTAEGRKGDFAEWCRQNGFNPKVARAKLRKANHKRNGSRYELNAAAIAIVKGK